MDLRFRTLGSRGSAFPAAFLALLFELKILAPSLEFKSNSEASLPCCRKKYSTVTDGKESTCNAGDLGSIPGSGRSPGYLCGYFIKVSLPEGLCHLLLTIVS